jgi:LysM repeat protein
VPFVVAQGEQEDGSIVHIVQSGDTIDSIAVAYGVTRLQVMELNNITDPRIIVVGQELIIRASETALSSPDEDATQEAAGEAAPETTNAPEVQTTDEAPAATAEATAATDAQAPAAPLNIAALPPAPVRSASSGDVRPAVDPAAADGQICVLMFEDSLQNRLQDTDEGLLPGGNIILIRDGDAVAEHTTDGTEPFCFSDLAAGDYVASVAPPTGYGLTTPDQLRIQVGVGTNVGVTFGAARDVQPPGAPAEVAPLTETSTLDDSAASSNPILDNLGLIVLAAAGIALLMGTIMTFALRRR